MTYLDPERIETGSRIDRLRACLRKGRYLLVFDGIERFLREGDNPTVGQGFSPGATEFLKVLADEESLSTVMITSRLWPEAFGPADDRPDVQRYRIQPFKANDLMGVDPFNWLEEKEVSELCSLLDGHIYAIVLAAEMLLRAEKEGASERLDKLRRALSATPPDRRTSRVIEETVRELDAEDKWNGLAVRVLERMSAFMSPVDQQTFDICYDAAKSKSPKSHSGSRETLTAELVKSNLTQAVLNVRREDNQIAYTMHPLVRGYIFHRIHRAFTDDLPDFTLPGFTAGTVGAEPGSQGIGVVKDIFERLYSAAWQAKDDSDQLSKEPEKNANAIEAKAIEAVSLCRSAFGVIRSRMGSNTAPRWNNYLDYSQFALQLGNLTKRVAPKTWAFAERHGVGTVEDDDGPLYADELAWLYNEIGLCCYAEGMMLDALAVWQQGYEINRAIDSYEEGGNYLFQSQCNIGAAYIHLGRLDIAYSYLREAERTNFKVNDEDHGGRIKGYLALVQHLRGDLEEADTLYCKAEVQLTKRHGGNPRALSVFLRHHGDLKMALGDMRGAKRFILRSRALAEAERYPELVAYARVSLGHWYRVKTQYPQALHEYNAALSESRRIGIRRLESEALSELSRLACDLGDAQIARQRATDALRIANESSLGLRQTHGLVVLGRATILAGDRKLGIAYLKHAQRLAKQQEYWLRGSEADEQLQQLGVED